MKTTSKQIKKMKTTSKQNGEKNEDDFKKKLSYLKENLNKSTLIGCDIILD